MEIKKERITSVRAAEMLKKNTDNRTVRNRHVATLAKDMLDGNWVMSGDTIKIAADGVVLDGQHRLLAQVKAGVTLNHIVVYGVEKEAFQFIDTGMKRSARDVFYIAGAKYTSKMPAMISRYLALKQGKTKQNAIHLNITNSSLLAIYDQDPEFWTQIARQSNIWCDRMNKVLSPAIIGSHYAFLSDISNEDAYVFFQSLCYGEDMVTPVAALRKLLYDNKFTTRKLTTDGVSYAIIVAWNHFRAKRNVNRIIVKKGSTIPKAI